MQGAIVVTGAAGALGRAVVQRLADAGLTVVTIQRSHDDAPVAGAAALVAARDLSSESECERAFAQVRQTAGSLSGLVNLAGEFLWRKFVDAGASAWDKLYAANVKTALNSCKAALPSMAAGARS